jgi:hypothetical protein
MSWIEIEQNSIVIAGLEIEIDVRAAGSYSPGYRGACDRYQQIEPDEPASFEVSAVEFRTSKRDATTNAWVPTSDWQSIPVVMLLPEHMTAIADQCIAYHQDMDQRSREDEAEARRAA